MSQPPTQPPAQLPPPPPLFLGVAALQLETQDVPTADNLAHINTLLESECLRHGVARWDEDQPAAAGGKSSSGGRDGSGSSGGSSCGAHLDILVLPEIYNSGYRMNEGAWYGAESLQQPSHSPSLAAVAHWAHRYRCYVVATLLEATADGHIYNSLVLAAPDGSFVTRPAGGSGGGSGGGSRGGSPSGGSPGDNSPGDSSPGDNSPTHQSLSLVRKHRASSLEGFVFRSAGAAGRGGEPWAHVMEVDAAPLLQKRGQVAGAWGGEGSSRCGSCSGSGGSGGTSTQGSSEAAGDRSGAASGAGVGAAQGGSSRPGQAKLQLAFSICYENYCTPPMEAIREAHLRQPLHLLISPFCGMEPAHDHPTFKWPREAAQRFAAQARAVSALHAAKLRLPVVACHHTGAWSSALPRLLPVLPRDPAPITGPMLGCSAVYAPGGAPLAQLGSEQEGMLLVQLPLLEPTGMAAEGAAAGVAAEGAAARANKAAAAAAESAQQTAAQLAGTVGAAAAESAAAGPGTPYACYAGGYVVEPVSWHVRLGFPLVETLGSFSYHFWSACQRRHVATTIAADGTWQGPVPPLDDGAAWRRGMVAAAAAAAVGLAAAVALRPR